MPTTRFEPGYLEVEGGKRFFIHNAPAAGETRAALVYVHPFAEEMNRSKRMVALQARALAQAGCATLRLDLLGCGDSAGSLRDATWSRWLDDIRAAVAALRRRTRAPLWLWGLRSGALLASHAARQVDGLHGLLLWQPVGMGRTVVQQFLRLKSAGDLANADRASVATLRQQLARGEELDVAGYVLSEPLVKSIEEASLAAPPPGARVAWFEVSSRPEPALMPASVGLVDRWRALGLPVGAEVVPGPAFWQTTEVEEAPALIDSTTRAVLEEWPQTQAA